MDRHHGARTDLLRAEGAQSGPVATPRRIETDRLVLERVHRETLDFDRLHALFSDLVDPEAVFERCGWDHHEDPAATRSYLADRTERWERGEFFEYALEWAANGELVGTGCIERSGDDGAVEFGFWLRKPYWGRGIGGEGTDALVHVAFECLDVPFVVAGCLAPNEKSRRAIEKFVGRYGGAYVGSPPTVSSSSSGEPDVLAHHEWTITRSAFERGESGLSTTMPGVEYGDLEF